VTPLSFYARFVRRHLIVLVACVLLGLAVASVMVVREPRPYRASAAVLLTPLPSYVSTDPSNPVPPNITIDTEAALVTSDITARAVARATGADLATVRANLLVSARPLTAVLDIAYSAARPAQAARGASVAARALLQQRKSLVLSKQAVPNILLERQIRSLEEAATQEAQSLIPSATELAAIEDDLEKLRNIRDTAQKARTLPGRVIEAARVPRTLEPARLAVPVVSGALLGVLAGVAIGAWRDLRS
jgi:hypothetical protein